MGIVTGHTVFNDPPAGPVIDALAVGAAYPIFFLSEMALTAHLVAVIQINLHTFFSQQKVALIFIMTGKTG